MQEQRVQILNAPMAVFQLKQSVSKPILSRIRKVERNLSQASDGSLLINHGSWSKNHLASLCQYIEKVKIDTGLRFNENKASDIPRAISTIQMPHIKLIHLENNLIESVEPLTTIFLPELQSIIIYGNKIVNIHSFRRAFWPSIKVINISNNRITQYGALSQTKAPELTSLSTQWQPDPPLCTNCSWVLKLETNQLESLCLRSRKRMWQQRIYNKMEGKHRKRQQITIYLASIPT